MEYHLQPRDYAKAFKFHYGIRSPLVQWFLIMLLVLFSWAMVIKLRDSFDLLSVAFASVVAIGFGNFAFGGYLWSRHTRKQLRQMGKDQVDVRFDFDNETVRFADAESSTELSWEKIIKWYGQENLILLYRHNSFFHIVDLDQLPEERALQLLAKLRCSIKGDSGKMNQRYRR